jgi:outer membrane PBP1 activator LpoA protein
MKKVQVLAMVVCAMVVTGCATTSEVQVARDSATMANERAEEALRVAQEAKRMAQEADMRASRSEEMLNRGFKRSMYK